MNAIKEIETAKQVNPHTFYNDTNKTILSNSINKQSSRYEHRQFRRGRKKNTLKRKKNLL